MLSIIDTKNKNKIKIYAIIEISTFILIFRIRHFRHVHKRCQTNFKGNYENKIKNEK